MAPGLSPRTWGWTRADLVDQVPHGVVPTHVGVDPQHRNLQGLALGCPHARGGGPARAWAAAENAALSPRTWGWTSASASHSLTGGVVPTHVGVDPNSTEGRDSLPCCPHARGGGPAFVNADAIVIRLSPRTWGWTGGQPNAVHLPEVVPTHVGVDPDAPGWWRRAPRCPHARGGGPDTHDLARHRTQLSPRTWGWTTTPVLERER